MTSHTHQSCSNLRLTYCLEMCCASAKTYHAGDLDQCEMKPPYSEE